MASNRLSIRPSIGMGGYKVLPEMFKHRLHQLSEESVTNLQAIWVEAGYEEVECQRLLGDLLDKVKVLFRNEIAAEQQILDHAKVQVRTTSEELRDMNEKLGRPTNIEYLKPMNYTDKLAELERLIDMVIGEVSERQGLLDEEIHQIDTLLDLLGEPQPAEDAFSGPPGTSYLSDVRLNLMKSFRENLEETKAKRLEEATKVAKECYGHMQDLMYAEEGYNTMSDSALYLVMDKNIIKSCKNTKDFCLGLTKQDLQTLAQRLKRFAEEKECRRRSLAETGEEIAKLWSLLRVPSVEREIFQNSFKKNLSMETINKGYQELTRLQELRKSSLSKVIENIRSDILTLWIEAGIESDTQRQEEFPQYYLLAEQLDETILDMHEVYYHQIRTRVEELKPILMKITRRETIIQERIELEHIQLNPERLTARGPNAREERKREEAMTNRVKNIEKLNKEVLNHIQTWEETNGPFYYGGERYAERIIRQEEEYVQIRDTLRTSRKRGKDGCKPSAGGTVAGSMNNTMNSTTSTATTLNNNNNNNDSMAATSNKLLLASSKKVNTNHMNATTSLLPSTPHNTMGKSMNTPRTAVAAVPPPPPTPTPITKVTTTVVLPCNEENQPPRNIMMMQTNNHTPMSSLTSSLSRQSSSSMESMETNCTNMTLVKDRSITSSSNNTNTNVIPEEEAY